MHVVADAVTSTITRSDAFRAPPAQCAIFRGQAKREQLVARMEACRARERCDARQAFL